MVKHMKCHTCSRKTVCFPLWSLLVHLPGKAEPMIGEAVLSSWCGASGWWSQRRVTRHTNTTNIEQGWCLGTSSWLSSFCSENCGYGLDHSRGGVLCDHLAVIICNRWQCTKNVTGSFTPLQLRRSRITLSVLWSHHRVSWSHHDISTWWMQVTPCSLIGDW